MEEDQQDKLLSCEKLFLMFVRMVRYLLNFLSELVSEVVMMHIKEIHLEYPYQ